MTQSMFARKHQQQFVKLYSVQSVSSIGGLVSCPMRGVPDLVPPILSENCYRHRAGGAKVVHRFSQYSLCLYLHVSQAGSCRASTLTYTTASHSLALPRITPRFYR